MADIEHSDMGGNANQHAIHRWAHADQAARFAQAVAAADVGKVSKQASNNTFWVLIDHTQVGSAAGWLELTDVTAAAAAAAAQATANAAAPAARTLTAGSGLTGGGTLAADRSFACDFGTGAGKVCQGNDSRLSDARTPTSHASTHLPGGADEANPIAAGATLTDADQTLQWSTTQGYHRMPATTTSATRAKTLGVTNAVAGSCYVLDFYSQGHDVTIINGGSGAGTIDTITAGTKVRYVVRYDGVNWVKGVRMPLA